MRLPKRKNGNGHEIAYERDAGPNRYIAAALEAFEADIDPVHPDPEETGTIREPLPIVSPMDAPESAVLHFAPNDSALFVKWTSRRTPPGWLPVARFAPQSLGSHVVIVGRRFVAPLTADAAASLEAACGRSSDYGQPDIPAEVAELQCSCILTYPKNRTWHPWVKYRGLWFAVTPPISRINAPITHATVHERKMQRLREQRGPDVAIV